MRFTLPWAPSLNKYYRHIGYRTLISREGRTFRKNVCALLARAGGPRMPPVDGRIALLLDAFPPDRRIRDLDNLLKPTLDSLQHAGVYRDDSQIDVLLTRRREVVPGGRLDVRVIGLPLCQCPLCGAEMNGNPHDKRTHDLEGNHEKNLPLRPDDGHAGL